MGYAFVTSRCFGCKQLFSYNPVRVPSIMTPQGHKEPICYQCVLKANPQRVKNGLRPIIPLPGAYDACDESELP
jgi:hypothetical protein